MDADYDCIEAVSALDQQRERVVRWRIGCWEPPGVKRTALTIGFIILPYRR